MIQNLQSVYNKYKSTAAKSKRANKLLLVFAKCYLPAIEKLKKSVLITWRDQIDPPSLRRRMGIKHRVELLESEIAQMKETVEGRSYSAYNSNNPRGYDSLGGEQNDESKVNSA